MNAMSAATSAGCDFFPKRRKTSTSTVVATAMMPAPVARTFNSAS